MTARPANGELQVGGSRSILSIGGHPKDAALYTGGTIALLLKPAHGIPHHEKARAASNRGERVDVPNNSGS